MNKLKLEDAASTKITGKRARSLAALAHVVATLPQKATRLGRMLLLAAACLIAGAVQGQPTISTTFVLPSSAADASKPGFVWRVHQVATAQHNNNARTEAQLAGLLGENIADPNAQGVALAHSSPPNPSTAPIAFDIGTVINLSAVAGDNFNGNFVPDDQMPGLPGTTGNTITLLPRSLHGWICRSEQLLWE